MSSPVTIECYSRTITILQARGKFTEQDICENQKKVVKWCKEHASPTSNLSTLRMFYASIIWYLKNNYPDLDRSKYQNATDSVRKQLRNVQQSQTLPQEKKSNMLEWSEVLALKESAKEKLSDADHLLYCLYTMTPPLRADYDEIYIKTSIRGLLDNKNYLIISKDKSKWKFIFTHYKTAKTFGKMTLPIPNDLAIVISSYIGEEPYPTTLFGNYIPSPNALSKKIVRIFKTLCDKTMGINLLRHSYITDFYKIPRSIKEKKVISDMMLHSYTVAETYAQFEE